MAAKRGSNKEQIRQRRSNGCVQRREEFRACIAQTELECRCGRMLIIKIWCIYSIKADLWRIEYKSVTFAMADGGYGRTWRISAFDTALSKAARKARFRELSVIAL